MEENVKITISNQRNEMCVKQYKMYNVHVYLEPAKETKGKELYLSV